MTLLKKLQIKEPSNLKVLGAPDEVISALNAEGWLNAPKVSNPDGLLVFCTRKSELQKAVADHITNLGSETSCWIAYPKRSGSIATDITRDDGWQPMEALGWLPVRLVSLNNHWSALRFKPRSEIKSLKRGMDPPGIDRVAKTVKMPEDLRQKLEADGLLGNFESRSFSQRREWVVGILEARKEETRIKRIAKIAQDLSLS